MIMPTVLKKVEEKRGKTPRFSHFQQNLRPKEEILSMPRNNAVTAAYRPEKTGNVTLGRLLRTSRKMKRQQRGEKQGMGKYQAVIFDLDGVICFTDQYHYQAWKAVADELGAYFDEEINNRLRGVSRMDSLEIILERYDGVLTRQQKEALAEKKNALYRRLLENMTPADLSDEVRQTLHALRAEGLRLAIGSSSKNTRFILGRLGLADFFDAISDGTNITRSKPDPQVFQMAAEFLELAPVDCLVVEDAPAGIEAARAGGFDSAGLGEAARCGMATYAMSRFADLLDICG